VHIRLLLRTAGPYKRQTIRDVNNVIHHTPLIVAAHCREVALTIEDSSLVATSDHPFQIQSIAVNENARWPVARPRRIAVPDRSTIMDATTIDTAQMSRVAIRMRLRALADRRRQQRREGATAPINL
jgi:hypothetical protein